MAVDLRKRPAVRGRVTRGAVCRFLRLLGLDPADVRGFTVDLYTIRVEVIHRNQAGEKWTFPDGTLATYYVTRDIT